MDNSQAPKDQLADLKSQLSGDDQDSTGLVLPITHERVQSLLQSDSPNDWFQDHNRLDVVCVHLLQMAPRLANHRSKALVIMQTALSDLMKSLDSPAELAQFRTLAASQYQPKALRQGLQLLGELKISLKLEREWDTPSPINADGTLNGDFNATVINRRLGRTFYTDDPEFQSLGLNVKQARIASAILGDPEESIDIQGFAGTGKTRLIRALVSALPKEGTFVMAKTYTQLQQLLNDPALSETKGILFGDFAKDVLISHDIPRHVLYSNITRPDFNVSDETIASQMGLPEIGNLRPNQVAKAIRGIITIFCDSDAEFIGMEHLPKANQKYLDRVNQIRLLKYANDFWSKLTDTTYGVQDLPLRHYHLIKWASLLPAKPIRGSNRKYISAIVDEAHDLTPALRRLLNNSETGVYALGDTFQRLDGAPPQTKGTIVHREMELSMRAGREIDEVINPILTAHPRFRDMEAFKGSRDLSTKCTFYKVRKTPQDPYAILTGSNWHVFEYVHQLISGNAKVALLPGTARSFLPFAMGIVSLFNGRRAETPELFRFRTWEDLARTFGKMKVFPKIERSLKNGYSEIDLQNTLAKTVPIHKAHYIIGRAEDAKNWEFDNVMLSPELFSYSKNEAYVPGKLSTVYLAASRAKRALAVPDNLKDWTEQQKDILRNAKAGN